MLSKHHRLPIGKVNLRDQSSMVFRGSWCKVIVQNKEALPFRFGTLISRKVSKKAVVRNRIRRQLFAWAECLLVYPLDVLVILYRIPTEEEYRVDLERFYREVVKKTPDF